MLKVRMKIANPGSSWWDQCTVSGRQEYTGVLFGGAVTVSPGGMQVTGFNREVGTCPFGALMKTKFLEAAELQGRHRTEGNWRLQSLLLPENSAGLRR